MFQEFVPPDFGDTRHIVYDVETNGLDWKRSKVVGYVLTWGSAPEQTKYFPVAHETGRNYNRGEVEDWIRANVVNNPSIEMVVGHNLKFDLHMSKNHDIDFTHKRLNCTRVNAALLNENQFGFELDECARHMGLVNRKKGDELYAFIASKMGGEPNRNQMAHFWRMPADCPLVVEYAEADGSVTWELWESQRRLMEMENLMKVWEVECRVVRTLFRMERRGVKINYTRLLEVENIMHQKIREAEKLVPEGLNTRAPTQMKKFCEDAGATNWPLTAPSKKFPKGQPSFTEDFLKTFPEGQAVITIRKLTNLINSFLGPLKERHMFNGRVHCNYNQCKLDEYGVVSGRLSCNDPNLQQVPKRDKVLAPLFRSIFVPDDGMRWASNDYKQQEFVVFAYYSRSQSLMDGYRQEPPVDIHSTVSQMLGVERDPTAKRMNLGMVYGMGVQKLADSLSVPLPQARGWMNDYHRRFPEAKSFMKRAETVCRTRINPQTALGYVTTLLGRRRRLDYEGAHKAGNQTIQGTSADITKLKMAEIDEYFMANGDICHLLVQVHDDICWQFPDTEEGRRQNAEAQRIMTNFGPDQLISLDVPLRIDHSEGRSWAEASFH